MKGKDYPDTRLQVSPLPRGTFHHMDSQLTDEFISIDPTFNRRSAFDQDVAIR